MSAAEAIDMSVRKRVLIIEDDGAIRSNVIDLLEAEGYEAWSAEDGSEGLRAVREKRPDLVLCDVAMPEQDGYEVLRALRSDPETAFLPFIFLTAKADRNDVRTGMALGADDYVTKPFKRRELLDAITARFRRVEETYLPRAPGANANASSAIVCSPRMRAVYEEARLAARSDLSVLILGETGVGKDVLAHEIHLASPRASGPFVAINCAALSESLLESELFGHEKGAFTGAVCDRPGLFEAADGGTVFLDEIGDLPKSVQVKLLRVLEDKMVLRVGGRAPRKVDVRILSATNVALEDPTTGFRQDLFFRLSAMTLHVPPMRERGEDIEPLVARFLDAACAHLGRRRLAIETEAMDKLLAYPWPGNVRELRNAVERAVVLCTGTTIGPKMLPDRIVRWRPSASVATLPPGTTQFPTCAEDEMDRLRAEMLALERQRISDALAKCGGNQTAAAELLGMSRRTLVQRLGEMDMPRPRKR